MVFDGKGYKKSGEEHSITSLVYWMYFKTSAIASGGNLGQPLTLDVQRPLIQWRFQGRDAAIATGKLKLIRSPYLEDWLYVRSLLSEDKWKDVKITLPPPGWWHIQLKNENMYDPNVYDSDIDMLKDLSAAVKQEILTLYDAGV